MIYGIPNGSVILLTGKLGSGFDIFSQQILYASATARSCSARYITLDRTIDDIESEITARTWDIQSLLSEKRWEFVDLYTLRMNIRKGVAGAKALTDALAKLPNSIPEGTWTAIDTVTYLLEGLEFREFQAFLDDFVAAVREKGGAHFLMMVEGLQEERFVTSIAHIVDGYFDFTLDAREPEGVGNIRIMKLRKTPHATRLIPYRITEKGISIETVTRVA
jgi:KaiC/GvpD/RAD55 family RecA-like ATPase